MSNENYLAAVNNIQQKSYTIRGHYVMLDKDLATLYRVETRALKQAVKRNMARFPHDFMFELGDREINDLVSQNVIPSKKVLGGARPFAFTEQGVAALSAILTSGRAIEVNIAIMRAFVVMRKFIAANGDFFRRLERIETKQLLYDQKFEKVFKALERADHIPQQGIFYDGQVFDAHRFVSELVRKAKKSIVLIDNYIDDSVLALMGKRKKNVTATVYTKSISKQLALDVKKYNEQYAPIDVEVFKQAHDRFLIIDEIEIYHIGASLKDLGKKWFAFSKFERGAVEMLKKLPVG